MNDSHNRTSYNKKIIETKTHNEEDNSEECWETATPVLSEVAQIAYKKVKEELRIHPLFELAINGEEDWYYPIIPIE